MKNLCLSVIPFCLFLCACSADRQVSNEPYVIKYVNLAAIYEYAFSSSNDAQVTKKKLDELRRKMDEIKITSISNKNAGTGTTPETEYYQTEINKQLEYEKAIKADIYSRIKTAVNNVASRYNVDFILNSGDGVIYSRPSYDLTYEVIKEYKNITFRTSPEVK